MKVIIGFVFVISSFLNAQTIGVVDFMKVEPENTQAYMEVEKMWKNIHQTRLKKGLIKFWGLYGIMFSGANNEYNYVTVTHYNSMKDFDNSYSNEINQEAFSGKSQREINRMMDKTGPSRTLVRSQPFNLLSRTETLPSEPTSILLVNFMTVEPGGNSDYVDLEREIYKDVHEESVKQGGRSGWSVWGKIGGDLTSRQFVTVDSYSSWDQIDQESNFGDLFKKVHPDKNMEEVSDKTIKSRILEKREIWRLIDSVKPSN